MTSLFDKTNGYGILKYELNNSPERITVETNQIHSKAEKSIRRKYEKASRLERRACQET